MSVAGRIASEGILTFSSNKPLPDFLLNRSAIPRFGALPVMAIT
jgi:hypothetical protein